MNMIKTRPAVAWALFRREALAAEPAASLADGTWRPRGARLLQIRDPKPRLICCVPIVYWCHGRVRTTRPRTVITAFGAIPIC